FTSAFPDGEVTTFRRDDLPLLKDIVNRQVESIKRVGRHPTAEQTDMFAYHLPKHSLSSLIDIFVLLSQLDDSIFFMYNVEDVKFLADIIENIPLPLRARYTFLYAPINKKNAICFFRFADMIPDKELVRSIQAELDQIIYADVQNIVKLMHGTNCLEDTKDVAVTTLTTEKKTAEVIAAISEETQPTCGTISNAPQIRSIIELEEELDINTTNLSTSAVQDIKVEKQ
ncbi:unnamed protein product, partial [Rotaria sp. Silwood1]